jgi:DNA adenine methylase
VRAPDDLATQYEKLWQMQQGRERRFYDAVRARFNQTHQPHYLLYLLARCVKASVRYNANGEFNQSPDNRRKGRQPNAMRADICQTARLMHGKVAFSSEDYRQVIAQATEGDLVYLDPPYQGVCANRDPRYIEGVTFDDLVAGLAHLNEKHVAYIVSYDGRTGNKTFGKRLPDFLQLQHLEVHAGRSSQATLLGRRDSTYETLYLSPALVEWTGNKTTVNIPQQLPLFGELT